MRKRYADYIRHLEKKLHQIKREKVFALVLGKPVHSEEDPDVVESLYTVFVIK